MDEKRRSRERNTYQEKNINRERPASREREGYRERPVSREREGYRERPASREREGYRERPASREREGYRERPASREREGYRERPASREREGYRERPASRQQSTYSDRPASRNRQLNSEVRARIDRQPNPEVNGYLEEIETYLADLNISDTDRHRSVSAEERVSRRDEIRKMRVIQERNRQRARRNRIIFAIVGGLIAILLIVGIVFGVKFMLQPKAFANGMEYYESGEYELAIEEFQTAIEEEDRADEAYLGIALCSWEINDYDTMSEAFESAYSNGASVTGVSRHMLSIAAMEEEDYQTALVYIEEGLMCEGNSDEVTQELLRNEIVCYESLAEWTTALDKVTSYLELYPDDTEAQEALEFLETR